MIPAPLVVECIDGNGQVRWRERIVLSDAKATFTVGRSPEADVVLDDPHVAGLHCLVCLTPSGRLTATDLVTVNGIAVGRARYNADAPVDITGQDFSLGKTKLRVRSLQEGLAPEKPLDSGYPALARNLPLMAGIAALLYIAKPAYETWLAAPIDFAQAFGVSLGYAAGIAASWIAIWSLLSRIIQGEWRWVDHALALFSVSVAAWIVAQLFDMAQFAFAWPPWPNGRLLSQAIPMAALLYLSLAIASRLNLRSAALIATLIPAAVVAVLLWYQGHQSTRDVNQITHAVHLYPPALRVAKPETAADFFTRTLALRDQADKAARELAVVMEDQD